MKIYVGNLSYDEDQHSLQELFGTYGEVANVQVITDRETGRPRGFGFVEMASSADAQKAIDALNGKDHLGRQLKVNEAQERTDNRGGGGGGRRSFSQSRY